MSDVNFQHTCFKTVSYNVTNKYAFSTAFNLLNFSTAFNLFSTVLHIQTQ